MTPCIYHDYAIDGKFLKAMNLDGVKAVRIGNNQRIPTLDEIVQNFANVIGLYIEVKESTLSTNFSSLPLSGSPIPMIVRQVFSNQYTELLLKIWCL